jgi:hypothetical protein
LLQRRERRVPSRPSGVSRRLQRRQRAVPHRLRQRSSRRGARLLPRKLRSLRSSALSGPPRPPRPAAAPDRPTARSWLRSRNCPRPASRPPIWPWLVWRTGSRPAGQATLRRMRAVCWARSRPPPPAAHRRGRPPFLWPASSRFPRTCWMLSVSGHALTWSGWWLRAAHCRRLARPYMPFLTLMLQLARGPTRQQPSQQRTFPQQPSRQARL